MTVCRFYQQGRCKFGDKCRDEHSGRNAPLNSQNPYAPLQKSSSDRGLPATGRASQYKLDKDTISRDLTNDRPLYILSAYGPGRDAPLQLFGGPLREHSFEELRTRHYELTTQGKQQEAVQEAQALIYNAEQQMKTALNDLDGAIKYVCDGENDHPNRIDICKAKGQLPNKLPSPSMSSPGFSQTSQVSPFGKVITQAGFGQHSSTPAFDQTSATSAFGKPSGPTFGQPSAPVSSFGQAPGVAFGKPQTPAFGQSSTSASIFGQTSSAAFGQPAAQSRPITSFGQPPPILGQMSTQTSAFSQSSSQAPLFGKPPVQEPAFGLPSTQQTAFGRPSIPSSVTGPSQGAFKVNDQPRNPFGAPSQSTPFGQSGNAFSADATAAPSVRRISSPYGLPTTTTTSLLNTGPLSSQSSASTSDPSRVSSQPLTGGAFGRPSTSAPIPVGQLLSEQQSISSGPPSASGPNQSTPTANAAATRRPSIQLMSSNTGQNEGQAKLKTWNGNEVHYIDDIPYFKGNNHSEWQRIWFPDGPPTFTKTDDLPEAAYDTATKERYKFAIEHGSFGNGGIPLMPPRKDWCSWNL